MTAGVTAEHLLQDYFKKLSLEDLEAMQAILKQYSPDVAELAEPRELRPSVPPADIDR